MSADPVTTRAIPEPQTDWSVTCPECAGPFNGELLLGIVEGARGPAAEDQFQMCPACGALVEIVGVRVVHE